MYIFIYIQTMLDAKRKKGIVKLGGGSTNEDTILSPRQGMYYINIKSSF